jgi:hypothetical protein
MRMLITPQQSLPLTTALFAPGLIHPGVQAQGPVSPEPKSLSYAAVPSVPDTVVMSKERRALHDASFGAMGIMALFYATAAYQIVQYLRRGIPTDPKVRQEELDPIIRNSKYGSIALVAGCALAAASWYL